MQDIKQINLCNKFRQFIPKAYRNDICPKPSTDKFLKIKSQRLATSKKRIEKLKSIQKEEEENDILKDDEAIVMDDDRSGTCTMVNEENPDNRGESDSASSSDSGLEIDEE